MTLRRWALKPGELKRLDRRDLLLFSLRCALRVEPWRVDGAAQLWDECLSFVLATALDEPGLPADLRARVSALANAGARECNRLQAIDEPLGRCHNYAHQALREAALATALEDRTRVVKSAIDCAKLSASIGAIWAHAGRVSAPTVSEAVELTCSVTWPAIRADIEPMRNAAAVLAERPAPTRIAALRSIAPLWSDPPSWAAPPPSSRTDQRLG